MLGSFGGKKSAKDEKRELIARTRVPVQTIGFLDESDGAAKIVWRVMTPVENTDDSWHLTTLNKPSKNTRVRHLDESEDIVKVEADAKTYSFEEAVERLGVWEFNLLRQGLRAASENDEDDLGARHFKHIVSARGLVIDAYGKLVRTAAGLPVETGTYRLEDIRQTANNAALKNLPPQAPLPQVQPQPHPPVLRRPNEIILATPEGGIPKGWLKRQWHRVSAPDLILQNALIDLKGTDEPWDDVIKPFLKTHYPSLKLSLIAPEMREEFCETFQSKLNEIAEKREQAQDEVKSIKRRFLWLAGGGIAAIWAPGLGQFIAVLSALGIVSATYHAHDGYTEARDLEREFHRKFLTADTLRDDFSSWAYEEAQENERIAEEEEREKAEKARKKVAADIEIVQEQLEHLGPGKERNRLVKKLGTLRRKQNKQNGIGFMAQLDDAVEAIGKAGEDAIKTDDSLNRAAQPPRRSPSP